MSDLTVVSGGALARGGGGGAAIGILGIAVSAFGSLTTGVQIAGLSVQNNIESNMVQGRVQAVARQVQEISDKLDGTDGDVIGTQVWNYKGLSFFQDESNGVPTTAEHQIKFTGFLGYMLWNYGIHRFWNAYNFAVLFGGHADETGIHLSNMNAARPEEVMPGESDIEMLRRVLPAYTWEENVYWNGSISTLDTTGNPYVTYVWSPPSPTLDQIKNLFRFTPASGPPDRFACSDLAAIFSLLPVQW